MTYLIETSMVGVELSKAMRGLGGVLINEWIVNSIKSDQSCEGKHQSVDYVIEKNIVVAYITELVLRLPDLRENLENVGLEENRDLIEVAADMVHHRKNAFVDIFSVFVEVLEENSVVAHYFDGSELFPVEK